MCYQFYFIFSRGLLSVKEDKQLFFVDKDNNDTDKGIYNLFVHVLNNIIV